jgi:transketolase N-terminal domain/subunit
MADIDPRLMANAIRFLSMDAIKHAGEGHPGTPLGAADIVTALFTRHLRFNPMDPQWFDRDRFVESNGHGSMLVYALLYLSGYDQITLDDIRRFRQLGSRCEGHPEYHPDRGIEVTTGPLGQGIANAAGMALAEAFLSSLLGTDIVDHFTYALVGDGCLQEGVGQEVISLAGHLRLGKLIFLWDDNRMTDDGPIALALSDNMPARFRLSHWHVQEVDGHDAEAVAAAILLAKKDSRPSMIACRTIIGRGLPQVEGTRAAHSARLDKAQKLPFLPEDPRVIDSTGALALSAIPQRMLVVGGGIIGLEMATVYSTLGSRIDVVEMLDGVMAGVDRDLVKVWEKRNARRFDHMMLNTKTVSATATEAGIAVGFEGANAPAEPQLYDLVLVAVGRSANGKHIDADNAGVVVTDRGLIPVDRQMRTNVAHIYAIGDIVGQPMLAHKAVHEAHVAAEAAAGRKSFFDARQIPSVAYTDPEVAWAGLTEEQCRAQDVKYSKAVFPWAASGRAIANGRDEGFTKLMFDDTTHRCIGGGIVGTHAGDLISEVCLAVEMGCDPADIGKTIHPHPTLGESIGMTAEIFEGVCTDVPLAKRRAQ